MTPDYEYKGKCHIRFFNCDNMEFMRECKENEYELCICDPPYGIGISSNPVRQKHDKKDWDKGIPTPEYFEQLFRVSKNRIIWGGNYFNLPPTQCFIFWYKQNPVPNFADGELAWTSFKKPAICIDYRYYGNLQGNGSVSDKKIHPTQKPIDVYREVLKRLAKQGDKILDTHGGSMTLARACYEEGYDLDIMELDKEYFDKGVLAFKQHVSQYNLFQQ